MPHTPPHNNYTVCWENEKFQPKKSCQIRVLTVYRLIDSLNIVGKHRVVLILAVEMDLH